MQKKIHCEVLIFVGYARLFRKYNEITISIFKKKITNCSVLSSKVFADDKWCVNDYLLLTRKVVWISIHKNSVYTKTS